MTAITYSKDALKSLRRMPRKEAQRIQRKIKAYAIDPASQRNNIKALTGSHYIRLRVGDWRVIMDERGDILEVIRVGARGDIYR